ncbi:hypothetical protein HK104_009747 [Borealophlyctis nickersoniae]|nr:hypothetical protein HK104_009747 [Borealophlyctis nickersoniae]
MSTTKTVVFAVGAVYKDVLLFTDSFPKEDSKQRATNVATRVGGNAANTLQVLSQYRRDAGLELEFVGAFAGDPPGMETINDSSTSTSIPTHFKSHTIRLTNSTFRGATYTDPTSYIISTPHSRTIINHNTVPDFTVREFQGTVLPTLDAVDAEGKESWVHIEGRNVGEVTCMVDTLLTTRSRFGGGGGGMNTVSIEFEKPGREGLDGLVGKADVLFFSRVYVEGTGFTGAPERFLESVRGSCRVGAVLFVTWGSEGAYTLVNTPSASIIHVPAPRVDAVVDTVGAGDTFIAGCILALSCKRSAEEAARFGCRLASEKCAQDGFEGLVSKVPLPWP